MALERPGSLRSAPLGTRRRLTGGRIAVALFLLLTTLAIVVPAITLVSLELDRRSLLVERVTREAELQLLSDELKSLTNSSESPVPASPAP